MRASSCLRLAIALALSFVGGSAALAQCPTCGPGGVGFGHPNYRIGDYSRYGGFDANAYYNRGLFPRSDAGDCTYRHYPPGDLFHQYYIGNNCGGVPASMYPAPNSSIPPFVGHVYYTYEPFYPQEYMYPHQRTYHRYYDDGRGLTRAKVTYMRSPVLASLAVIPFHW